MTTVTSGNYRGNYQSIWGRGGRSDEEPLFASRDVEFVALKDEDLQAQFADGAIAQPKHTPGEFGSGLPSSRHSTTQSGAEACDFQNGLFQYR